MTEPADTPDSTPDSTPATEQTTEPASDSGRGSRWQAFKRAPRAVRWTAWTALGLVVLLLVLAAAAVVVVRRPLPQTDGEIEVPGLSASVEVVRDEQGIAQVYADTDADLMFAQGFVHAQERFFEMDFRRHVTAGRLSEIFGSDTLETDRFIRTMGWRRVAEREWALLEPATRDALTAYAAGVNAYIADRSPSQLAAEYSVLGLTGLDYSPAEWDPIDSLAWLKAMAWDLRGNMDAEVDRVLLSLDHTEDEIASLWPAYPFDEHPPIVSGGGVVDGVFEQNASGNATRNPRRPAYAPGVVAALERVRDRLDAMPELIGKGRGIGSNSWVVDGEHSATGKPILANDPHLGISQPGIWMQMGLHCRARTADCTLDTSGFTFSGVPGVIIGHNADIAWGMTNLGPDVTDLFLEQTEGDDRYVRDGATEAMEVHTETIKVRGGDDVEMRVRETVHGPLISDVSTEFATVGANAPTDEPGERGSGYAVALAWTALEPAPTADAILALNRASDWDSFRAAAADFSVPAQNLVYADREGHIGYQSPGRIPIRRAGNDGTMPVEGWVSANDWTGEYIPFDGLPGVLDPEEGFIATANQAVIDERYPYLLTKDWDYGYRSTRIREVLESEGELSVSEMAGLQLDSTNPMAETLVPYLLDVEALPSPYYRNAQNLLRDWDFSSPVDSPAAAYFNVVWRTILDKTFHDELRQRTWPDGGDRWFRVVSQLLSEPAGPWWDDVRTDDTVETRDDILRASLIDARDEMTRRQSRDPRLWEWGHLHRMNLRNPTLGESGVAPVERLFNRNDWEVGGGSSIVDATSWNAVEGFEVTAAPSMRMVVSLADWDDSRWINLTGVSGHPASSHFSDQTELYVDGETLPWAFTRGAVQAAAEDTLVLTPAE
ncbi:penicillin acylase family protein [Nocardioides cavernae]|uniref:Penicillin acylase family protein n=1 Tax=Nocardioides cavernae TaxID=1921566 RepID=A0ABR8N758_9ACTN|nr:penicillin acylase family protein [Nocardioides cavernae]MBD3923377.1 penicillin acylase family protein [Nocardioides cavernae]MBM7511700.1 penicillin amidase [Nocardioides cavernae]